MIYLELFIEFFKIGLFSIGGGQATIPFLQILSSDKGWFSSDDLSRFIAISESTPGAIGVNMATFSGYLTTSNALGALVATLGLITPSIIIIILISMSLTKFKSSEKVSFVFYGLRPASTALITAACFTLMLEANLFNFSNFLSSYTLIDIFNLKNVLIAIVLGSIIFKYKMHPIFYIVLAAVIGIVFQV